MRLFKTIFIVIVFLVMGCGYNTVRRNMSSIFSELAIKESPKTVCVRIDKKKITNVERKQGIGSGVLISEDGYIITNYHIIKEATKVTIITYDMNEYKAIIVGKDPKIDVALLKIKSSKPFLFARIGNSDKVKVGDWVVSIGNPFGFINSVTTGIVSGRKRLVKTGLYNNFMQIDMILNSGSSGSPLFNLDSELIGINTMIIGGTECTKNASIGFAIPINIAMFSIEQLKKSGRVVRGKLGVTIQSVNSRLKAEYSLESRRGAFICNIVKSSSADRAGLKIGDVIINFDGKEIKYAHRLLHVFSMTPVGKTLKVIVLRNNEEKILTLTVMLEKLDRDKRSLISKTQDGQGTYYEN